MATPKIKLTYFNIRARGEPIRVALHIGNVAFEDHRIEFKDWPTLKPTFPFGALPVVEVDGKVLAQSGAILRYVGKLTKLYPSDEWKAAKVDEFLDSVEDALQLIVPTMREQDAQKKQQAREALVTPDGALTNALKNLDKLAASNGNGPYLLGDELTIADLKFAYFFQWIRSGTLDFFPKTVGDGNTHLLAVYDNVFKHPGVVSWEAKRQ
eukprot:TRINITY_DN1565_c2_g2_i1.p2 TRINITY_DN1565_c2_g2~~TRINITY_DN1565_c2_g2_i1.p2  ORF type:complete len:210 (+),score=62.53 TRINITY_DN1565_c2_g2_i1:822-1451(+)